MATQTANVSQINTFHWNKLDEAGKLSYINPKKKLNIGNRCAWYPTPNLLEIWNTSIFGYAMEVINSKDNDKIFDSAKTRHFELKFFMTSIQQSWKAAIPTIITSSKGRNVAQRAAKALKRSILMKRLDLGFDFYADPYRSDTKWVSDADPTLFPESEFTTMCGARIWISPSTHSAGGDWRCATLGGLIQVENAWYGITAAHAFFPDDTSDDDNDSSNDSNGEYDSDGDGDDGNDDDNPYISLLGDTTDDNAEAVMLSGNESVGKAASQQLVGRLVYTHPPSKKAEAQIPLIHDTPYDRAQNLQEGERTLDEGHLLGRPAAAPSAKAISGIPTWISEDADWAMIEILNAHFHLPNEVEISGRIVPCSVVAPEIPVGSVAVASGFTGSYFAESPGMRVGITMPGSHKLVSVWTIDHTSVRGDCGSWVMHPENGRLYGMIVATSPKLGISYCVPLARVFDELSADLRPSGAVPALPSPNSDPPSTLPSQSQPKFFTGPGLSSDLDNQINPNTQGQNTKADDSLDLCEGDIGKIDSRSFTDRSSGPSATKHIVHSPHQRGEPTQLYLVANGEVSREIAEKFGFDLYEGAKQSMIDTHGVELDLDRLKRETARELQAQRLIMSRSIEEGFPENLKIRARNTVDAATSSRYRRKGATSPGHTGSTSNDEEEKDEDEFTSKDEWEAKEAMNKSKLDRLLRETRGRDQRTKHHDARRTKSLKFTRKSRSRSRSKRKSRSRPDSRRKGKQHDRSPELVNNYLVPPGRQRRVSDSDSAGEHVLMPVKSADSDSDGEYVLMPVKSAVGSEDSGKDSDVSLKLRRPAPVLEEGYQFYNFLPGDMDQNRPTQRGEITRGKKPFLPSQVAMSKMFERLQQSRLAEIHRKFENDVQQAFWRGTESQECYGRVMQSYSQQIKDLDDFRKEMGEFDLLRRQAEEEIRLHVKLESELVKCKAVDQVLQEVRARHSKRKEERKRLRERDRAKDRAVDSRFVVKYTKKALETGLSEEDVERELLVRAHMGTSERDKYDNYMMLRLEGKGKEVSKSFYTVVHSWLIKPESLTEFGVSWVWEGGGSHNIIVMEPLSTELKWRLAEHTLESITKKTENSAGRKTRSTENRPEKDDAGDGEESSEPESGQQHTETRLWNQGPRGVPLHEPTTVGRRKEEYSR